jgi:hypothetical protein
MRTLLLALMRRIVVPFLPTISECLIFGTLNSPTQSSTSVASSHAG